jgi:phosphate transport system permease protein
MGLTSTTAPELSVEDARIHERMSAETHQDELFRALLFAAAALVLLVLGAAAVSMLWGGRLAFQTFGWKFIVSDEWDAVGRQFGAFVPIYGTLVSSAIAMLIAVPVSFGIALFLTEIAPGWLQGPIAAAVELLAGIPSIIYGMWGLFSFVPFMADHVLPWINAHLGVLPWIGPLFRGPPLGIGMLTAGIVLGIMVIPFISSVMRDVFRTVPAALKESAYALGETMAVTFVLGNAHQLSASLLMPGNSIAATIANEFTEADSDIYLSSLIALGFLLFVVTFVVLAIARLMLHRLARMEGR